MRDSGLRRSDLTSEVVLERLRDTRTLAEAMPGIDDVDIGPDGDCTAIVRVATALGHTTVRLDLTVREDGDQVRVVGQGRGGEYVVNFVLAFAVRGVNGGTELTWTSDVRVSGVLGSIGQRVIPGLVRDEIERTIDAAVLVPG